MESTILGLAADIFKPFETCKLKAYLCPAKVWTIGWGHTAGVKRGDTCTQTQADEWLDSDTRSSFDGVLRLTSGVPTTTHQHAAMVSLAYNIGVGSFRGSSVLREHRAGNYLKAADAFLLWDKATVDGDLVVLRGLQKRRAAERAVYSAGVPS